MKYWILTTEYPPFYGGGISTYCYHTAKMLSENNHHVTVFINDTSIQSIKIEQFPEARIIRFNPSQTNSHSFLGYDTNISFEFAHVLKTFIESEGQPDIIESQDYNGIAYFLLQFKHCLYDWCKNIPVLITMHSPSYLYFEYNQVQLYKQPNYWIGEMERFCVQAADTVISPSKFLVDELKKRFSIHNNVHIVANPFQTTDSNNTLISDYKKDRITFYGKLSPQKGAFSILERFEELWNNGFEQKLVMIGGQDIVYHPLKQTMGMIIKDKYKKFIKDGKLILQNKIAPTELKNQLKELLFFIVPSTIDNLPYVVLELMSMGKIVLVSKSGGQSEIIFDSEDGFIFDYTTKSSLDEKLKKLFRLPPDEIKSISQKAIHKIKNNYSYATIYKQKIEVINAVLKNKNEKNTLFPFIRNNKTINLQQPNNSLLSVIIPFYNLGDYIDDTVTSVLNSSYKNIELLIINDGSTDEKSKQQLNTYANHPLIKVIHKENSGLANTRNYGAQLANGDYIAFLDADDTVHKKYYEKAMQILTHYTNVHFVGAWTQYFGNSKNIWPTFNPEPPIILTQNTINSSALVYKKEAFLKFGLNDPQFKIGLEDYESVINLLSNGANGIAIPEKLFNYRVRNKSMIKSATADVRREYYNRIKNKYTILFTQYTQEITSIINSNNPPLHSDNATLDESPFQNNPLLNKLYRKAYNIAKSNSTIKNTLLYIKSKLK